MGISISAQLYISFKTSKQNYVAINYNFNKVSLIFSSKRVNQSILMNNGVLIYMTHQRILVKYYQQTWS